MTDFLIFEVEDGIATLTMNRPEKLNAFTGEMLHGLVAALDECDARDDVRAVILTGAGRGFCSGGDIGGMGEEHDSRPHITKSRIWGEIQAFPKRAARFEKPLLAAVNGAAIGGGMDLALACDIRIAGESAKFAETYAKIGLLPGGGGSGNRPGQSRLCRRPVVGGDHEAGQTHCGHAAAVDPADQTHGQSKPGNRHGDGL